MSEQWGPPDCSKLNPETVDYETALAFFRKQQDQYEKIIDYLSHKLSSKDAIIDVGANIGFFTLLLLEKINFSGEAHLFEPIPNLVNACRQTFADKPWQVHIHPYALGEEDGKALLYMASDGNIGWNTLEVEKTSSEMKPLEVEVRRFDHLGLTDIGLIKIDVEGAEYKVLSGMLGTLKNLSALPILVVGVGWGKHSHPHWDKELSVFRELFNLGYQAVDVDEQKIDIRNMTSTQDVIFLPPHMANHGQISCLAGKHVIFVFGSLELGGSERQGLLLARYLAHEQSVHVEVWGFNSPGRATTLCEEYGIPWRIFALPWSRSWVQRLKGLARFAWALRRVRPDVILPYTMFPNVVCGLVWRWTGARLCVWNQRDEGRDRMGAKLERWVIHQTPWFISNSQDGADFLVQALGVEPDQIWVIRNGIELAEPESDRATSRSRLGVSDDCFLACMVANLSVFKDHATLIKAWRKVVDRLDAIGHQAVLLLAGRFDNTYESLKALVYDLELGRSVQFLGKVDDIPGLLGVVDLGVFSSRLEGCPNGVLECMAAGLAVAGTDVPGIREAVGPDGYPFLAPPEDVEALAARILKLAMDPKLCGNVGIANRRRIDMEFNLQGMCEKTVVLLSKGLGQ